MVALPSLVAITTWFTSWVHGFWVDGISSEPHIVYAVLVCSFLLRGVKVVSRDT